MKTQILFLVLLLIHCMNSQAQIWETTILPSETSADIDGHDLPHHIYLDTTDHAQLLDKILLFTPGTNGTPEDYTLFLRTAAELGYHTIGLSYENLISLNLEVCPATTDPTCHGRARSEVYFGNDTHDSLDVDFNNSIINRFTKLLEYLIVNHPHDHWNQFLDNEGEIVWEKVVTAGHSQGGGHAAFASKFFDLSRVIMISWIDWYAGADNPNWIKTPGATADSAYFGFIHTGDASIFNGIPTTWENFGMDSYGGINSVDTADFPYNNTHSLITSAAIDSAGTQRNYHNATAVDWMTPINQQTGEPLYKPVWEYLLGKSVSDDPDPDPDPGAIRISPEGASYIDPEIHDDADKLAFQTNAGVVWLSDLNPLTGEFVSADGKDLMIATGAEPLINSFNGPEFGVDENGWAVFYCKSNGGAPQPWRAEIQGEEVVNTPLASGTDKRMSQLATKDASAPSIRLVYSLGPSLDEGEIAWKDEDQPENEFITDSLDEGCRWVDETRSFIYIKQTGENKGQAALFDTETMKETILTNDTDKKTYPYGWIAPEYDELLMLSIVNDSLLGIYKFNGGDYMERILLMTPPEEAYPYRYIGSPEPVVAGGKSFISFVLKKVFTFSGYVDAQVWLTGIDPDPEQRIVMQCDDGTEARRTDPESYVGDNQLFIIYNQLSEDDGFEIWRYATGIPVTETSNVSEPPKKHNLTLFPNPAKDQVTLSIPDNMATFDVVIYDISGQETARYTNQKNLNIDHLEEGLYFVSLKSGNLTTTSKLIVTKR